MRIEAVRTNKTSGRQEQSTRYYISSKRATAKVFNENIRSHWAIENKLHWSLDVSFKEDSNWKRMDNCAANFRLVTKTVLTMLKTYPPTMPGTSQLDRWMADNWY